MRLISPQKNTVGCIFETAKEVTRLVLFGLEAATYELAVSTVRCAIAGYAVVDVFSVYHIMCS